MITEVILGVIVATGLIALGRQIYGVARVKRAVDLTVLFGVVFVCGLVAFAVVGGAVLFLTWAFPQSELHPEDSAVWYIPAALLLSLVGAGVAVRAISKDASSEAGTLDPPREGWTNELLERILGRPSNKGGYSSVAEYWSAEIHFHIHAIRIDINKFETEREAYGWVSFPHSPAPRIPAQLSFQVTEAPADYLREPFRSFVYPEAADEIATRAQVGRVSFDGYIRRGAGGREYTIPSIAAYLTLQPAEWEAIYECFRITADRPGRPSWFGLRILLPEPAPDGTVSEEAGKQSYPIIRYWCSAMLPLNVKALALHPRFTEVE